jgi:sterol desaturase/sphingolipid hydroxylase (fatty acid hydroxylase superfamily)
MIRLISTIVHSSRPTVPWARLSIMTTNRDSFNGSRRTLVQAQFVGVRFLVFDNLLWLLFLFDRDDRLSLRCMCRCMRATPLLPFVGRWVFRRRRPHRWTVVGGPPTKASRRTVSLSQWLTSCNYRILFQIRWANVYGVGFTYIPVAILQLSCLFIQPVFVRIYLWFLKSAMCVLVDLIRSVIT